MKIFARSFSGAFAVILLMALAADAVCAAGPDVRSKLLPRKPSPQIQTRVRQAMLRRPLGFEANAGQVDREVLFLSRSQDHALFLTTTGAVLVLRADRSESPALAVQNPPAKNRAPATTAVANLKLVGSNPAPRILGTDELPGKVNYLLGNGPARWHKNLPLYSRVHYVGIYPGVDLVFYGSGGQLEYDFIVAPGTDPSTISFTFVSGTNAGNMHSERSPRVESNGDLALSTPAGDVRLRRPSIYQERDGKRYSVSGGYEMKADGSIGFHLAQFDATRPLIIDPVLSFSTFLGGGGIDSAAAVALDSSDNIYVAGTTASSSFPVTPGAFQQASSFDDTQCPGPACSDGFVSKLSPDGATLIYSTYLGGTGTDGITGIALDSSDNAYVAGFTGSLDFPGMGANSFQGNLNAGTCASVPCFDAFIVKLNSDGSGILYSTYLGGSSIDFANDVAVDASGNAYLTGYTGSADFPATHGAPGGGTCLSSSSTAACVDAFVGKLNPSLSGIQSLSYLTYLGGNGDDVGFAIRVDSGNAYVVGSILANDTGSATFPVTSGAFQSEFGGGPSDAFLAVLDSEGNLPPIYATFLGGNMRDQALDLALLNISGTTFAYLTGTTLSDDFPASPGAFQTVRKPGQCPPFNCADAFLAKFNPSAAGAASRVFSTFLGGSADDQSNALTVDSAGSAVVAGATTSTDFPTLAAVQPTYGGGTTDAFVTRFSSDGSRLIYSTYLGGRSTTGDIEIALGLATDSKGAVVIVGQTDDSDFPAPGALFPNFSGAVDAFVAKLAPAFTVSPDTGSKTINAGQSAAFQITVTPDVGFSESVTLDCTVTPVVTLGPTCGVSPNSVPTLSGPGTGTLTVTTTGASGASAVSFPTAPRTGPLAGRALPGWGLFLVVLIIAGSLFSKRHCPWSVVTRTLLIAVLSASCGGGSGNRNTTPPPSRTPAGTYTVTVTGTSLNLNHSAQLSVTVN